MLELKSIKDFTDVLEFTDGYHVYKKDNRARTSLNKTLETCYKAVYRQESAYTKQWKSGDIDWSGEEFWVVTAKGRTVRFHNSEWAFFDEGDAPLKKS